MIPINQVAIFVHMKAIFRFYKTSENKWYIDLPEWGGDLAELEMVEGADTMLDIVSGNNNECFLELSNEPFEKADTLILMKNLSDSIGGGDYLMESYKGEEINHNLWLCGVTESVFGEIPEVIYVGYLVKNNHLANEKKK